MSCTGHSDLSKGIEVVEWFERVDDKKVLTCNLQVLTCFKSKLYFLRIQRFSKKRNFLYSHAQHYICKYKNLQCLEYIPTIIYSCDLRVLHNSTNYMLFLFNLLNLSEFIGLYNHEYVGTFFTYSNNCVNFKKFKGEKACPSKAWLLVLRRTQFNRFRKLYLSTGNWQYIGKLNICTLAETEGRFAHS